MTSDELDALITDISTSGLAWDAALSGNEAAAVAINQGTALPVVVPASVGVITPAGNYIPPVTASPGSIVLPSTVGGINSTTLLIVGGVALLLIVLLQAK